MGKSRNRKNAKQKSILNSNQNINVVLPESISKEEMQHIIAHAIIESESIKEEKTKVQKDKELIEWHNTIGYKEYDNIVKDFLNRIKVFFKILFLREEDIDGVTASILLLNLFLSFFFHFLKFCSTFAAALLILFIPLQFVVDGITPIPWYLDIVLVLFSLVLFVLSRLLRMVAIEIEKVENYNFLFGLFTSVTSIISIVVAVIAIVKGI